MQKKFSSKIIVGGLEQSHQFKLEKGMINEKGFSNMFNKVGG